MRQCSNLLLFCFSPSDLEADLEDNQDYDSAVSQSDTSFPFSDQSASMDSGHNHKSYPWSNQSKLSSYSATGFKTTGSPMDQSKGSSQPSSYRSTVPGRRPSYERDSQTNFQSSQTNSPSSPKSPSSVNQASSVSREPMRPVSSVLSRYQPQEESTGYQGRFNRGVRGPVGQQYVASLINKENKEEDVARRKLEKVLSKYQIPICYSSVVYSLLLTEILEST